MVVVTYRFWRGLPCHQMDRPVGLFLALRESYLSRSTLGAESKGPASCDTLPSHVDTLRVHRQGQPSMRDLKEKQRGAPGAPEQTAHPTAQAAALQPGQAGNFWRVWPAK